MSLENMQERMEKVIDNLEVNYSEIRAGRANPAILNRVSVEYYGVATPINQVASISVPEARQILITPWDKSTLSKIERAIQKSDIGINPTNDGNCIRIVFPELTEDRRKELVKNVKSIAEETKVAIRNIRRDGIDEAKKKQKSSEITEDDLKSAEEKIQKITDKFINNVEEIINKKEKEIMEI